eukprot:PhF_6_TR30442/c0_g1_i1/m.44695
MDRTSFLSGVTSAVAKTDKTWHALRAKYHILFDTSHLPHVESWYNKYATASQKELFRTVIKRLLDTHVGLRKQVDGELPYTSQHLTRHMVRLYGETLALDVKASAERYLSEATEADRDAFREIFSAINAADRVSRTHMKEVFVGRQPTDLASHKHNILKVHWDNEKVGDSLRAKNRDALERRQAALAAAKIKTSFSETDYSANKDASWDELDEVARNKQAHDKDMGALHLHDYNKDPKTGATEFRSGAKKQRDCVRSTIPLKMSNDTTAVWIPTSKQNFKAMRPKDILYSLETSQPARAAMVTITASNGVVIPRTEM